MSTFPKVMTVQPLTGKRLRVEFSNGIIRVYDCNPLLEHPVFQVLKDEVFFRNVRPDAHGYGVFWNDDIDLAESELWIHGMVE